MDRLKKLWRTSKTHYYRNGHSERSTLLDVAPYCAKGPILGILDYSVSEQVCGVDEAVRHQSVHPVDSRRQDHAILACDSDS